MSFSFRSCRELKDKLGHSDAINELTEVLFREYENKFNEMSDKHEYIKNISTKHGIVVNFSDMDSVKVSLWENYIVNTYSIAEIFLYEFLAEYCSICNENYQFSTSESKLKTIIKAVVNGPDYQKKILNFGEIEVAIFEYYRFLRNDIIHSSSQTRSNLEREFNNVISYKEKIIDKYNVKTAPNLLSNLKYEDFNLFTRVLKNIAWGLSEHGEPTYEEIADKIDKNQFNKLKNNKGRMKNSFLSLIRTMYGYDEIEAEEVYKTMFN